MSDIGRVSSAAHDDQQLDMVLVMDNNVKASATMPSMTVIASN